MRQRWRGWVCVGLLLLFPLLLFTPVSLGNYTVLPADALTLFEPFRSAAGTLAGGPAGDAVQNPLLADLILQNYPWKVLLVDALKTRTLPLWDPYLFSGHPFLANGQHSALYPLTWLFFVIPLPRAFGVFVVIQLGLAGVSMYVLGRVIKAGTLGALASGIVFQFSGFMVVSVVHPMIISGASWLPLLLALVECTVRRRRFWSRERAMLPWALLGAVVLGLQILAGHLEITYFVLLVIAAFGGWRLLQGLLSSPQEDWRAEVLSPAFGLVLLVGLGLVLGGAQLLPFYEVASTSFRQGAVTLQEVLGWAYPKRRIVTFLVPNFFGNPTHRAFTDLFSGEVIRASVNAYGGMVSSFDYGIKNYVEGGAYLGILPLLLALVAVLRSVLPGSTVPSSGSAVPRKAGWLRRPYVPFFTLLSLFSLGCVFGTPIYALVYALPFLDQSHSPFRWVFPFTVAMAALAGLGVSVVVEGIDRPADATKRRWVLLGADPDLVSVIGAMATWAGVFTAIVTVASRLAFGRIEPLVEHVFWSLTGASHTFPDARTFHFYLVRWMLVFAGFLLSGGLALRISRSSIRVPLLLRSLGAAVPFGVLAVIVILIDLLVFGTGFNPKVAPAYLDYEPPVVAYLRQDTGLWRLSTFDPHGRNTFHANVAMFYGFQDVRGYDSLFSAQYARYMQWIEPQDQLPYNRIAPFRAFSSLDSPLTDMLNVKYILTEEEIPLPKYRLVYEDSALRVYENLGAAPRVFTLPVAATVVVADVEAVGDALMTYDPRHHVIVEATDPTVASLDRWAVEADHWEELRAQPVVAYGLNEVLIEVTLDEPAWLILTDAYAPGWKAFVRPPAQGEAWEQADDETELPIVRVAGSFRGVLLEEGGIVRFRYTPDSVKVGFFASFLGGMVVIFLAVIWVWRLVYHEREEQSTVQRLAKNSIVPISLTLFNRVMDFAFAALMLRILGPSNAGDYYYATKIFVWFDILTNFGLNTYLTREVARDRENARSYLLNTTLIRLGLSVAAVPILLGFLGVRQTVIAGVTAPASPQVVVAILLLYLGLVPNSISTGITALFYAYEKAEVPAAVQSVTTIIRVTVQTMALVLGWGIVGLAGTSIAINVITLTVLGALAWRSFVALRRTPEESVSLSSPASRRIRREMVRDSWPLMLNHLLATLFFTVDVFLMEPILGPEAVGLYSIGGKLVDALMVVPSMFTMALFPVISRQARGDRDAMARFYGLGAKILVLLALPAALISTVAAREMVLLLGGAEYLPGAVGSLQIMAWLMPISWINGITQYVLIALDRQRYLTRAYAVGFAFSLVANLILMPRLGYAASAAIHVLAEMVLFVPFVVGVRRYLGGVGWRKLLVRPLGAAILTGGAAVLVASQVGSLVGALVAVVVYPLLIWVLGALTLEERSLLAPLFRKAEPVPVKPVET
jgi:O-antigen/teichoic acid export membrane protein